METQYYEKAKQLADGYYQAMRALMIEIRGSEEKAYGKRIIFQNYNRAAELARTYGIATPPLREKTEKQNGRGIDIPAQRQPAPPPVEQPAKLITYESPSPEQEIKEHIKRGRKPKA